MSSIPDWLAPTRTAPIVPDWLDATPIEPVRKQSKEVKALLFEQFETVLPRVLENVCGGLTVNRALAELPIPIDTGAFMRWLRKKPQYYELYREAKEVRTETWTGEMVKHALGNEVPTDLDRSKVIIDTLKWLVSRENKKEYGETKTLEINTQISITAALDQARTRVIEATVIDDDEIDVIDESQYKQLPPAVVVEDDDDE